MEAPSLVVALDAFSRLNTQLVWVSDMSHLLLYAAGLGLAALLPAMQQQPSARVWRFALWQVGPLVAIAAVVGVSALVQYHAAPFHDGILVPGLMFERIPKLFALLAGVVALACMAEWGRENSCTTSPPAGVPKTHHDDMVPVAFTSFFGRWHAMRITLWPSAAERTVAIRWGLAGGLLAALWAHAVFFTVNYEPGIDIVYLQKLLTAYPPQVFPMFLGATLIHAVIAEELLYRLLGQGLLLGLMASTVGDGRPARWLSVLLVALLWTWAHSLSFQFAWGKYLQILPFGLMLGYLMERHGLWACMTAHFVHNTLVMAYAVFVGWYPELY